MLSKFRKTFLLGSAVLITSLLVVACQQDSLIRQRAEGKDIVFEINVAGTMTEVWRVSSPLGGSARSIGSVGSVASPQGLLNDAALPGGTKACYNLDGDGSADCAAGGTLTEVNTPLFTTKAFFGVENTLTIDRDLNHHLISTDSHYDSGGGAYTIAGWLNMRWTSGVNESFLAMWDSGDNRRQLMMQKRSDNTMRFLVSSNGIANTLVDVDVSTFTGWHHFALAHDGASTGSGYIDGQLVATISSALFDPSVGEFIIGMENSGTSNPLTGSVSGVVALKGYGMSASEVNTLYSRRFSNHQQIAGGHELTDDSFPFSSLTGTTAYWNLTSVTDNSGNGINLAGPATFDGQDIFGSETTANFATTSDALKLQNSFFDLTTYFAMGGWVWYSDLTNGATQHSITTVGTSNDHSGFFINVNGELGALLRGVTPSSVSVIEPQLQESRWYHFVYTADDVNKVYKVYLNGKEVLTQFYTGSIQAYGQVPVFVVSGRNAGQGFIGQADEVFYTKKRLSDSDIHQLYSSKLTHSNITPINQHWQATWQSEFANPFTVPLENGWIVNMESNDLYVDFSSLDSGHKVIIK